MGRVCTRSRWLLVFVMLAGAANAAACSALADALPFGGKAYTITGALLDVDGQPPASGTPVYILKVDAEMRDEDNFLQYPDLDQELDPDAIYATQTDPTGAFSKTLFASEVTSETGEPSSIAVAYFASTTSLATTTSWWRLAGGDTEVDVGVLKLWDAGSAELALRTILFDWGTPVAPEDHVRDDSIPSYLYAWDAGSAAKNPRWAAFTFDSSVAVPRAAFATSSTNSPRFFVTSVSKPAANGSRYQHRTSVRTEIDGWTENVDDTEVEGTLFYSGRPPVPFSGDAVIDGDMDTAHPFFGNVSELYVDLGAVRQVAHVLVHRLVVAPYQGEPASLRLAVCDLDEPTVPATGFVPAGPVVGGDWQLERRFYASWSQVGQARWLRIAVEGGTPTRSPVLESVAEIRVFAP